MPRNDDLSLILAKAKDRGFFPDVPDSEVDYWESRAASLFLDDTVLGGVANSFAKTGVKTNNDAGVIDWENNSALGYILHLRTGVNTSGNNAALAVGTDKGAGNGILISHKNTGAGLRIIGNPGSSIGAYLSGYSLSSLISAEVFVDNQGIIVQAKAGKGFSDGVTNGTTTFTSATANFTGADVGMAIQQLTQTGSPDQAGAIPSGTTIQSVTNSTTVVLSQAAGNTSSQIRFFVANRAVPTTQQLLLIKDEASATIAQFRKSGISFISSVDFVAKDTATQAVKITGKAGQTSEIFSVYKDGNAVGLLSVTAGGTVTTRFGFAAQNSGDTASNALNVLNASTTTHSILVKAAAGQVGDQISFQDNAGVLQSRVNKDGIFITKRNSAPTDAALQASELSYWFDATDGAAKLMIKAKQANGTVVSGSVALV